MKIYGHATNLTFKCPTKQKSPIVYVFIEIHLTLFDSQPCKYILPSVLFKSEAIATQIPFSGSDCIYLVHAT